MNHLQRELLFILVAVFMAGYFIVGAFTGERRYIHGHASSGYAVDTQAEMMKHRR